MQKCLVAVAGILAVAAAFAAVSGTSDAYFIAGLTTPTDQPDGNSVVLDAPAGLIVFDTGRHPEHTQKILEYARSRGRPVVAIINSHWHLDHVGGNLMLRAEYPQAHVYASSAIEGALGGFLANYRRQLEQAIAATSDPVVQGRHRTEMALIDAGAKLGPTDIVARSGARVIAGRSLDFHLEQAATAGDVWVFDRRSRTLLAGDLLTLPAPFFDTACPKRWQATLDRLARVNFKELIPGHGAPMGRAAFETYRTAFKALLACTASEQPKSACIDGWLKDAGELIPEGDRAFARGLIGYYVDQLLRGHAAKLEELCRAA